VKSEGEVRLGGKAMAYATHLEFMPVAGPLFADTGGEPEAAVFTHRLPARGRRVAPAPGVLRLQRRPRLGVGLAAPRRARAQAGAGQRRRLDAAAAVRGDDNPHSWFEHFDLVFVDPPHTGYSIAASEEARTKMLASTATSRRSPK
jgi:hypothetical protein